jgi:hypothetical protein
MHVLIVILGKDARIDHILHRVVPHLATGKLFTQFFPLWAITRSYVNMMVNSATMAKTLKEGVLGLFAAGI